jgi:3-polyprenyl-4-hydroxybenzoate decarboxylase
VPFVKFLIVVPTEDDKKQLQAAFEYIHNNRHIDTDFIAVNQIAHSYLDSKLEKGHPEIIVVDSDLFSDVNREVCQHTDTWVDNGIKICKTCQKHLEVTSYRD